MIAKIFFLHIPFSWMKIGWHTENQLPGSEKQCMAREEEKYYVQELGWSRRLRPNTGLLKTGKTPVGDA